MSQNVALEKDTMLAIALASGATVTAAAEQVGVDRRTVQRRLADPEFRRQVASTRSEMTASALGRITDSLTRAADAVAVLLDDPQAHIRLRAARILFNTSIRMRDAIDVDQRIRDLEEELARKQGYAP